MRASSLVSSVVCGLACLALAAGAGCVTAPDGSGTDTSETSDDTSGVGKFALAQNPDGSWTFQLKSSNGSVLLTSDAYSSRTSAIAGILSTESNGTDPHQYLLVQEPDGYAMHLVAGNNEVIATTHSYATKAKALHAVISCTNAVVSYLDKLQGQVSGARVAISDNGGSSPQFEFYGASNQAILISSTYASEAAAYDGAFAAQAAPASAYVVHQSSSTGFYFTIAAGNGHVIATSPAFSTRSAAQAGALAAQQLVPSIQVL